MCGREGKRERKKIKINSKTFFFSSARLGEEEEHCHSNDTVSGFSSFIYIA
jgi:hypothetical protein